MLADREEDRAHAVRGERLDDRHRALRPRAVVEGEHDFAGLAGSHAAGNARSRNRGRRWCRSRPCARCRSHSGCRGRTVRPPRCAPAAACCGCRRRGLRKRRRLRGGAALRDGGRGVDRDGRCDDGGRRAKVGASVTTVTVCGAGRLCADTAGAGAGSLFNSAGLLMTRNPKTPANTASAMAQAAMARRMALSQTLQRYLSASLNVPRRQQ